MATQRWLVTGGLGFIGSNFVRMVLRERPDVSTDEVYGHVHEGSSKENDQIAPRSPYAASKAGGDLQVLASWTTYNTPVLITRGSNTDGPYQYPEKLIPLFVTNLIDNQPVPVSGDGMPVRDWIHADDHARGIMHVLEHGELGNVDTIGGGNGSEGPQFRNAPQTRPRPPRSRPPLLARRTFRRRRARLRDLGR